LAEIDKEAIEFMTRLGGGIVSSLEDAVFVWYRRTHPEVAETFPFTRPHPSLPSWNEIIVGGLSIPPFVIGLLVEEDARKKGDTKTREIGKSIREFGEGNIFYAAPMLVKNTAVQVTPSPVGARPKTNAPPQTQTPPQTQRPTGGTVLKL